MGSSSSTSRRATTRGGSSLHRKSQVGSNPTRGSSSRKKRVKPEQLQSTNLDFAQIVTFNLIYSHRECLLRQLNWWILDGNFKVGGPFRLNKGGPAGPSGECGSVGNWNHCVISQKNQSPPPYRDIGAAAPELDLQATLSQAIQAALKISFEQPFEDANARTALLYLVERLAHQGLSIRTDLDLFSIYAHMKSMSATHDSPPHEEAVGTRVITILGIATRKGIVSWTDRMVLANRIKVDLHAEILEVQLYYRELQKLSGNKLRQRLERDKAEDYVLYSRWRLLFPRPTLNY
ncbi:hypothetical protein BDV93DRAFT_522365 [Ceratobasidium sp. AG-I]|nr:hypothetical protein BDV93DRAFT_522365 [Ceratobasidium sp. AG-I]